MNEKERAVMQQALEALEYENSWHESFKVRPYVSTIDAIAALRAVLSQEKIEPVQENVSKMTASRAVYFMERFKREEKLLGPNEQAALDFVISMLERQEQAEPVQEPVAWIYQNIFSGRDYLFWKKEGGGENWKPLYIAPPQRKPLPLKDVERLIYENTKINPNVADDKELLGYIVNAIRVVERAHNIVE